jgi:hypothetical protein
MAPLKRIGPSVIVEFLQDLEEPDMSEELIDISVKHDNQLEPGALYLQ